MATSKNFTSANNREAWLTTLGRNLGRFVFKPKGYEMPEKWRISCGFPSRGGLSARNRTIGQCWSHMNSGDGTFEIFINPTLTDRMKIAGVVAHELCHAIVGLDAKHGPKFKAIATEIGLVGRMTATEEGPEFVATVTPILDKLPPYPHGGLDSATVPKQATRLIKVECNDNECGCVIRMTRKWLDDLGAPDCACGAGQMVEAS